QTTQPPVIVQTPPPPVEEEPKKEIPDLRRGEFGIRYMPTFSSLSLRTYNGDVVDGELTMSQGYGVMFGLNFDRHVGIQAEVNYSQITQKYKDRGLERQVDISYINIPVMLSLNTDKRLPVNLNVVAGPQFGVNVGSSVKTTGTASTDTLKATVAVKPGDVGFAYGAGLEFALNKIHTVRLDLGFRGFYGLVDMNATNTSNNPDTYNILVKASRKTYAGYIGLTFCF
ncbi:MAG: porin family protein, partial [Bacteroidia bacterium]